MAIDKAVDSRALDTLFENIGNAIREKDGTTALITPGNMPAKIRAIRTGVDTSDATAAASDIAVGKTAYVNGKKVTGELSLMAQINVSYKGDAIRPVLSQTGITVEGFCEVSGNTLVNDNTKVITSIYIPGDAAPDNVLEGTTFSSEDYIEATGTMPDNGEASFELSNLESVDVAEGYYSGGTAKIADAEAAKIIPENIKKGVTILGVKGTMEASAGGDYNIAATTNSDGTQNLAITDAAGGGSSGGGSGETGTTSLSVGTKGGKEVPLLCSWQTDSGWMYTTQFATASRFTLPNVLIGGYVVFTIDPTMVASFSGFANNGIEVIDPVGLNSAADEYKVTLIAKVTAASPSLTISVYDS